MDRSNFSPISSHPSVPLPESTPPPKKILVLGFSFPKDTRITPSRLILDYCPSDTNWCVGVDFKRKTNELSNGQKEILHLYDLAGHDRIGIAVCYLRGVSGAVLLCHSDSQQSFIKVQENYKRIKQHSPDARIRMALVREGEPNWPVDEMTLWAKEQGIAVHEITAQEIKAQGLRHLFSNWSAETTEESPYFSPQEKLDFQGQTISQKDFSSKDLSKANFSSTRLESISFKGSKFTGVCFIFGCLDDVDFLYANLTSTFFTHTHINASNFSGANLICACFQNAKMQNVQFVDAKLKSADFSHTNVVKSSFKHANLTNVNWYEGHLESINFEHSELSYNDFSNATLSSLTLELPLFIKFNEKTSFHNVEFKIRFFKEKITGFMDSHPIANALDLLFNHEKNNGFSVLKTIQFLPDPKTKMSLMECVLNTLNDLGLRDEIMPFLKEALLGCEDYLQSPLILDFFIKKILSSQIQQAKSHPVDFSPMEAQYICWYITCLIRFSDANKEEIYSTYNSVINQILYQYPRIPVVKLVLKEYYQFEPVAFIKKRLTNVYEDHRKYIFLSQDGSFAMAVAKDYVEKFLYEKNTKNNLDLNWNQAFIYQKTDSKEQPFVVLTTQDRMDLQFIFNKIPLFLQNYVMSKNRILIPNFIHFTFNTSEHFRSIFIDALDYKTYDKKLIDTKSQNDLWDVLQSFLVYDAETVVHENTQLKENHIKTLEDLLPQWQNPQNRVWMYIALAGLFAYYSSASVFGAELESPRALRFFGVALLNRALQLVQERLSSISNRSSTTPPTPQEEQQEKQNKATFLELQGFISEGKNRFLHLNGAHDCTAVLANGMFGMCQSRNREIYNIFVPLAWR